MSDRYRPPTGPKGPKGSVPPGPKGTHQSLHPKQLYYSSQAPKRYKERDNYRPYSTEKSYSGSYDSNYADRPAGPSGYRDVPGQKRSYPEDASHDSDPQHKRRDFRQSDQREWDSRNTRDTREWESRAPRDTRKWNTHDSRDTQTTWRKDSRAPREIRDSGDRSYPISRDKDFPKSNRDFRDSRPARDEARALPPQKDVAAENIRKAPPPPRTNAPASRANGPPPRANGPPPRANGPPPRANGPPSRTNAPAPRANAPQDSKLKDRKKPPLALPKMQPKLRPNQIYLVYSRRESELYERVQQVGEGTYGKVYKAKNSLTGEFIALKKLRLESEREGFPITAIREIKLLQSFDHPNIVGLLEMMVEQNQIFMVFDYLDHDLTGLLTHPDLHLTEGHRKMIFKQLMEGLNYLHKKRVIHRDIKGSNILLDAKGTLKIADFGLARTMKVLGRGESPDYTNRVITIWYRPPELLLGSTDYGREVDIWGVGCLLMELYTKVATFQGTEEISQLYKIFEIMGTPTLTSWPDIENLPWFEMLKPRVNKLGSFEKEYKPLMTDDSFDLAQKLLEIVPSKRLTAQEALEHPYFHNEPKPERLSFMETLEGEWHEFETKKRRREERKRLQVLKNAKGKDLSVPPTQPKAPAVTDMPDTVARSTGNTPFDGKSISEFPMTDPTGDMTETPVAKDVDLETSNNVLPLNQASDKIENSSVHATTATQMGAHGEVQMESQEKAVQSSLKPEEKSEEKAEQMPEESLATTQIKRPEDPEIKDAESINEGNHQPHDAVKP